MLKNYLISTFVTKYNIEKGDFYIFIQLCTIIYNVTHDGNGKIRKKAFALPRKKSKSHLELSEFNECPATRGDCKAVCLAILGKNSLSLKKSRRGAVFEAYRNGLFLFLKEEFSLL